MSTPESLKAFLKEKKEQDAASGRLATKEQAIQLRATAIGQLFTNIEGWLKSSVDEGLVVVERDPYVQSDNHLGTLSEESLKLVVGVSEVFFQPRTGSVAGALARVDMTCGDRTLPIVLLANREWHFLIRGSVTRTDLVTEESFGDALKELLAG